MDAWTPSRSASDCLASSTYFIEVDHLFEMTGNLALPIGSCLFAHDRLQRIRRELSAPQDHDDRHRRRHEHDRADEPAEIAEREKERPLTAVDMAPGGGKDPRRAEHGGLGGGRVLLGRG